MNNESAKQMIKSMNIHKQGMALNLPIICIIKKKVIGKMYVNFMILC